MSAPYDPMTFDDLSELYRVEMKNPSVTDVRKDLFRAMANLMTSLRQEVDRQMSVDPDSVMTEGAELRRKKADRLCKDIVVLRTRKIASMAIRSAEGAHTQVDYLTDEERAYYERVLELTKAQLTQIDRLRGKRSYRPTSIDGTPVHEEPAPEPVQTPPPAQEPPKEKDPSPVSPEPPPYEEDAFDEPMEEEPFDDIPDEEDLVAQEPPVQAQTVPEPVAPAPEPPPAAVEPTHEPVGAEGQVLIRVLEDLPPFVSAERDYKLSKEDVVTLPKVLADILIGGGKAMAVAPTP